MRSDHFAQRRENPEPEEGNFPIPRALMVVVLGLVVWGAGYIAMRAGAPLAGGDTRTAAANAVVTTAASIDGAAIFNAQCAACHQASGQGLPGVFPPLAGSEWVQMTAEVPIAIVNDGLQDAIEVNGNTYNGVMPPFGQQLSAAEIAAVLSYVRSQWGNDAGAVSAEDVEKHRGEHPGHAPWTAQELRATFGQ